MTDRSHLTVVGGQLGGVARRILFERAHPEVAIVPPMGLNGRWRAIGAKDWLIGECLLDGTGVPAKTVITRAGDILLLPKNLPHVVSTPADPGHSVHLAFAIDREHPRLNRRGTQARRPGTPLR